MNPSDPVDVLARTLWGEARGEGALGMHAVANVIMNRLAIAEVHAAQHPSGPPYWWGGDVISICLKPWQFSCWNSDDPNRAKLEVVDETDSTFAKALDIARTAVSGRLAELTVGATSYKETSLPWPAAWGEERPPLVTIKKHAFYNLSI